MNVCDVCLRIEGNHFQRPYLSTVGTNVEITEMYWTAIREPLTTADWNSGERGKFCVKSDVSCQIK